MKTNKLWCFLTIGLIGLHLIGFSQVHNPVKWKEKHNLEQGNSYQLSFDANIDKGWKMYGTQLPENGPIATSIHFEANSNIEIKGDIQTNKKPQIIHDLGFEMDIPIFKEKVTFSQTINLLTTEPTVVKGYIEYMCCNENTCTPPLEKEFVFYLNGASPTETATKTDTVAKVSVQFKPLTTLGVKESKTSDSETISTEDTSTLVVSTDKNSEPLWIFFLIAFAAGLLAILTPCVFPMMPMTVSFFMRGSKSKRAALMNAFFFGFSIILIYTLFGALFSAQVFGPNTATFLSSHWIPNLLFFLLFLIFAISFFGAFELIIPGDIASKTDSKADKGGLAGAFFLALTTVIVSFSCTGPFIGALIVQALGGDILKPVVGMFGFGLAFATPFTLLAIFPSALKKLPKSGGWLNMVKVVFAFILLAFGLKFLSNIDQTYNLNLISRDFFLALWMSIFSMLGLYFLGKIKTSHDSNMEHVSVLRLMLAIATFAFVFYLATGLMGAPLKSISSLIPPQKQQTTISLSNPADAYSNLCNTPKYGDFLHLPHGLQGYFDYNEGLQCAKEKNKPALIIFKGHACSNCKAMESNVWSDPEILPLLKEKFVLIALYNDDRTKIPEAEQKTTANGKKLDTMGKQNLDLQISKYNTNAIPFYVIVTPDGKEITQAVTFSKAEFKAFLEK